MRKRAYNGDGVLVQAGATTYTQDLAAPLRQVLSDGSASYAYGRERLRAVNGPWYLGDALGSVRTTLNDAGAPLATAWYDPWGQAQGGIIAPFGFTGELQDPQGMVYLRARWYDPAQGTLLGRDPFAGWAETPYSLHPFQYGYSSPLNYADPTGEVVYLFEGGWDEPGPESTMTALRDYLREQKGISDLMSLKSASEASIQDVAQEVLQLYDGQCPAKPIIFIGYSRGGMHAQAATVRLNSFEQLRRWNISISLVVTIAPVEAFQPGWIPYEKQSIVRRHINILSAQQTAAAPMGDARTNWPISLVIPERSIAGTEEHIEPGTSHFTVAYNPLQRFKQVRSYKGTTTWVPDGPPISPSPVFEQIGQALALLYAQR